MANEHQKIYNMKEPIICNEYNWDTICEKWFYHKAEWNKKGERILMINGDWKELFTIHKLENKFDMSVFDCESSVDNKIKNKKTK